MTVQGNHDILIRNARLRGETSGTRDIAVVDGTIGEIASRLDVAADIEIDAAGRLVTESFANPHHHLCKMWTLEMMHEGALKAYRAGSMGNAMSAIEQASIVAGKHC